MPLYLVRHAKAGSRSTWIDDDLERPLVAEGIDQAGALVSMFAGLEVSQVLSSPAVRCRQTVEPLAADRGLAVEIDARLVEDSPFEGPLALLEDLPDGSVLCSHGDVIPDVVRALVRRGMPDDGLPQGVRKGQVVVLHREDGRFTGATHWPAP